MKIVETRSVLGNIRYHDRVSAYMRHSDAIHHLFRLCRQNHWRPSTVQIDTLKEFTLPLYLYDRDIPLPIFFNR